MCTQGEGWDVAAPFLNCDCCPMGLCVRRGGIHLRIQRFAAPGIRGQHRHA